MRPGRLCRPERSQALDAHVGAAVPARPAQARSAAALIAISGAGVLHSPSSSFRPYLGGTVTGQRGEQRATGVYKVSGQGSLCLEHGLELVLAATDYCCEVPSRPSSRSPSRRRRPRSPSASLVNKGDASCARRCLLFSSFSSASHYPLRSFLQFRLAGHRSLRRSELRLGRPKTALVAGSRVGAGPFALCDEVRMPRRAPNAAHAEHGRRGRQLGPRPARLGSAALWGA